MSVTAISTPLYGTATALTVTLDSLASAGARESTFVACGEWFDMQLRLLIKTEAGAPTGGVDVYAYVNAGEDSSYTYPATGADAALTMPGEPHNLKYIDTVYPKAGDVSTPHTIASVAGSMGGLLPAGRIGFVFVNNTGLALGASGNEAKYRSVQSQTE